MSYIVVFHLGELDVVDLKPIVTQNEQIEANLNITHLGGLDSNCSPRWNIANFQTHQYLSHKFYYELLPVVKIEWKAGHK